MLQRLAEIDWASLTHAYGSASEVPTLLRALASPKRRIREEALQTLFSHIWHQGTVYQATIDSIPFLYELLQNPTVQGKAGILELLQSIMTAYPRADEKPDPLWREKPSTLETTCHAESLKWAQLALHTASAGYQTLIHLLSDRAPSVRSTATFTLALCKNWFAEIEPLLRPRIDREKHPGVKAALVEVWISMWKDSARKPMLLRKKLQQLTLTRNEKPRVRLMAALGLLSILPHGDYPNLMRFTVRALRNYRRTVNAISPDRTGDAVWRLLADRYELRLQLCLKSVGVTAVPHRLRLSVPPDSRSIRGADVAV